MADRLRGAPDYTNQIELLDEGDIWGKRSTIGLAELATRLGALFSYDHRGSMRWYEKFDYGMAAWVISSAGAGETATINAERALSKGMSCKMTTCGGLVQNCILEHSEEHLVYTGRIGIEVHVNALKQDAYVYMQLWVYTGTLLKQCNLRWDLDTGDVYYTDDVGGYIDTGVNVQTDVAIYMWHTFKLVVDLDTSEYVRWMIGSEKVEPAGIAFFTGGLFRTPRVDINVRLFNHGGAGLRTAYIDNIIYTVNEP